MRSQRIIGLGVAALLAFPPLQAATSAISSAKSSMAGSIVLTAGKTKKKKSAKAKPAKVAAFKSCGTYMYRKDGKCIDARAKK